MSESGFLLCWRLHELGFLKNPGFRESQFHPKTFAFFAIWSCAQKLLRKGAIWSLRAAFRQKGAVWSPLHGCLHNYALEVLVCIKFIQKLHFSIFLHKNQKYIKVCKFLIFFYIKHMQKASKI